MRIVFAFALFFLLVRDSAAQNGYKGSSKPPVEFEDVKSWPSAFGEAITNDGNYVFYYESIPSGSANKLVIQSWDGNWKKEISGMSVPSFTNDSRRLVYKTGMDSLCFLVLGSDEVHYLLHVADFEIRGDKIAYHSTDSSKGFIIRDLTNGQEEIFSSVNRFLFSGNNKYLLLEERKDESQIRLKLIDLITNKSKIVWSGEKASGYTFSEMGDYLAFVAEKKINEKTVYELWDFKLQDNNATMLADNHSSGLDSGFAIASGLPEFTTNGQHIFFYLQSTDMLKPKPGAAKVDIWNYLDKQLLSIQQAEMKYQSNLFMASISIVDKRIIKLQHEDENVMAKSNDYVLLSKGLGNQQLYESNWNKKDYLSYYLVWLKDGSRQVLRDEIMEPQCGLGMSPKGKWIIYYDLTKHDFFSYEAGTGITRDITNSCKTSFRDEENDRPDLELTWVPWRTTWFANDNAVLIYDNYDIWLIDPSAKRPPVNITNGYGQKHHIKFELLNDWKDPENQTLLVLKGFNKINKDRGFFSKKIGYPGNPELLSMGSYIYGGNDGILTALKAGNADRYILRRMSATEHPNLFLSSDLRNFKTLTDYQPQKEYNWLSAELVHWKTFDGSMDTGILYKPENFDPNKKYPLILTYYEKRSNELNLFRFPQEFAADINISWFVSHGYIVFIPDIHYKLGHPGEGAYNAIVSAATWLSKKPWIDAKKMGINGFSFGGYQTNYVVTHSHIFAAVCEGSGPSDFISITGFDNSGISPGSGWLERAQGRMPFTIWQNRQLYINNSPIFNADKVTAPLLMMHNRNDHSVPFSQGVEFFTALRRLGKKAWMLQYDNSGHVTSYPEDYSRRVIQFFDHYLKGAPAPVWMTRGIRASRKEIDDGFELEPAGIEPGPGLLY